MQLSIALFFSIMQLALEIDLLEMDTALGNALNIGSFAGGILLTVILFVAFGSLAIYKKNNTALLIIGFLVMGFAVAVQWLSIFFPLALALIVALGIADKFTGFFREHMGR